MKQLKKILICFALSLLCLFSVASPTVAYALPNNTIYTNALWDLQQDENFDASEYPVDMTDYSLDVVQIAESSDSELFVYVYQPCSPNEDLLATSINISKSTGENLSYINHGLTLLNSSGTLYKYRVNGLIVNNFETRYYNISSIFRKWNADYDNGLPVHNENTISEVAFEVATEWVATTENDEVFYTATSTEVVTITDKYVGFVRFDGSYQSEYIKSEYFGLVSNVSKGYMSGFDSHFVAFNTDKSIDKLLSAELYFTTQDFEYHCESVFTAILNEESSYSSLKNNYKYFDEYSYGGVFIGENLDLVNLDNRIFSRIQTTEEFLSDEDKNFIYQGIFINVVQEQRMTAEGIEDLQDMQWVLRFYESEYKNDTHYFFGTGKEDIKWTGVADVSILRLEFEVDEVTYNLGVVDNKQTGDSVPDNETIHYVEPTALSLGIGGFFSRIWQGVANFFKGIFNFMKIAFWIVLAGVVVFFIVKLVIKIVRQRKDRPTRNSRKIKKTKAPIRRKRKGSIKNYRRKNVKKIFKKK